MTESRCLVRTSRHGSLVLATADKATLPETLVPNQPVLLSWQGQKVIGVVAIGSNLLRDAVDEVPEARILAVGFGASDVVAALAEENAAALRAGRDLLGAKAELRDAAWHLDHARLTFDLVEGPGEDGESWRERLAALFQAEIRFTWPGGEDQLDLGASPE